MFKKMGMLRSWPWLLGGLLGFVLTTSIVLANEVEDKIRAAEQGDVKAQVNLGAMYYYSKDTKDDAAAAKWFRLAADQGSAYAQFNLGMMTKMGHGVPKDLVQALMWFHLAALQGFQGAGDNRDTLAKLLTPEQNAKAQELAQNWQTSPKKP